MREAGIDVSQRRPQHLTEALARNASLLVTMGCGDECPYVPGLKVDDWPLRDPKNRPIDEVREIRDEIRERVSSLVDSHGWRHCKNSILPPRGNTDLLRRRIRAGPQCDRITLRNRCGGGVKPQTRVFEH